MLVEDRALLLFRPFGAGTDRFCGQFRRKPRVRNTARADAAREVAGF
jgi:hypothetical protein